MGERSHSPILWAQYDFPNAAIQIGASNFMATSGLSPTETFDRCRRRDNFIGIECTDLADFDEKVGHPNFGVKVLKLISQLIAIWDWISALSLT